MDAHPEGWLADALITCGVAPDQVKVERDDLCQEDVLTFLGADFADETLATLADLYLTFPCRFVFATDALQNAFDTAVMKTPAMVRSRADLAGQLQQKLEDAGLSGFMAFDPAGETLSNFAQRVESACGFGPGELLKAQTGGTIAIEPMQTADIPWDRLMLAQALLMQFGPDVEVAIMGYVAESASSEGKPQ